MMEPLAWSYSLPPCAVLGTPLGSRDQGSMPLSEFRADPGSVLLLGMGPRPWALAPAPATRSIIQPSRSFPLPAATSLPVVQSERCNRDMRSHWRQGKMSRSCSSFSSGPAWKLCALPGAGARARARALLRMRVGAKHAGWVG